MRVWLEDGKLRVGPYSGSVLRTIHIGVGERGAIEWFPAYRTQTRLGRVLQIKAPEPAARTVKVWLRVDGIGEQIGSIRHQ